MTLNLKTNDLVWSIKNPYLFWRVFAFSRKVRDYSQNEISFSSVVTWLDQFEDSDKPKIVSLLPYILFYSEAETTEILVKHNEKLLKKLQKDEIDAEHVIYVTIDEPGSSSHIMLNLLRDASHLQRRRVTFIDSRNILGLIKKTNELGTGAIIYIDDFAGTGNQFLNSRNPLAEQIPLLVGQFSEFFLLPCICIEAHTAISRVGVEVVSEHVHIPAERPLHSDNISFDENVKTRLVEISQEIDASAPLGYRDIASMVVFYRNVPNGMPPIFRGNVGQDRSLGILPRSTDFHRNV